MREDLLWYWQTFSQRFGVSNGLVENLSRLGAEHEKERTSRESLPTVEECISLKIKA